MQDDETVFAVEVDLFLRHSGIHVGLAGSGAILGFHR